MCSWCSLRVSQLLHLHPGTGCPDLATPRNMIVKRHGDTASVRCNQTQETWYVTCKGNSWIGDIGNCTTGKSIIPFMLSKMNRKNVITNVNCIMGSFPFMFILTIVYQLLPLEHAPVCGPSADPNLPKGCIITVGTPQNLNLGDFYFQLRDGKRQFSQGGLLFPTVRLNFYCYLNINTLILV